MGNKYKSSIKFENEVLDIELNYEQCTTKEEEESLKRSYQTIFSRRAKKEVPIDEIKVNPVEGEITEVITYFRVKLCEPLYIGLLDIHQRVQYVLPNLVEDLKNYSKQKNIKGTNKKLIQYAINGLEEILNKSGAERFTHCSKK